MTHDDVGEGSVPRRRERLATNPVLSLLLCSSPRDERRMNVRGLLIQALVELLVHLIKALVDLDELC